MQPMVQVNKQVSPGQWTVGARGMARK